MIDCHWYWPTGLRAIDRNTYDGMNLKENIQSNADGEFLFKWTYKYDIRNNLTKSIQYYKGDTINTKISCEYNVRKELITETKYNKNGINYLATYEYDDKGLITSKTEFSSSGKVAAKYRYQYETY